MSPAAVRELKRLVGADSVLEDPPAGYLVDATEARSLRGRADAAVLPGGLEAVRRVVAWAYAHEVPLVPRGGGTGFAGGAVPLDGGVVVSLERLRSVRAFDPPLWRMCAEAGLRTAEVRRLARENGLVFPPDPGAAEQSQLGGNVATNAGGPHAFKHGPTGAWVSGLEAVIPPGETIAVGGAYRKDVAGYDLRSLLVGSEGTLGIVTAAWLKLMPAPEAAYPVVALHDSAAAGCEAIERVLAAGLPVAALEFLDAGALAAAAAGFPGGPPPEAAFAVIAEAEGSRAEADALRGELLEVLGAEARGLRAPTARGDVGAFWRWRDGVSLAVSARRGGKVSEDIVVPVERLHEAIEATVEIGRRHGLEACSWGHAGDGNLHSTFLVAPGDAASLRAAGAAAEDLFGKVSELGGSISGEHGVGSVKSGRLHGQWAPRAVELHRQVKQAFDPKGLLNPGKKLA